MFFEILMVVVWGALGVLNLFSKKIRKVQYGCVWAALMVCLIQALVEVVRCMN